MAKRFFYLDVKRIGSTKVENSRIEKGLEQSMASTGFFSITLKLIFVGKDITGDSRRRSELEFIPGSWGP